MADHDRFSSFESNGAAVAIQNQMHERPFGVSYQVG
jgi:hypothetical protein